MSSRPRIKEVNSKLEVLEERVDGLREDIKDLKKKTDENSEQIRKVHDRINKFVENDLKHVGIFGGNKKEMVKGAGLITVIYLLIEFIKWILTTLI